MTRHRRIIDASLKRHLSAVYRTERLSGGMGQLVQAALRAALAHLPENPNHFNLVPALNAIRAVADRLRLIASHALNHRLAGLAEWGHLAMARVLTSRAKDALKPGFTAVSQEYPQKQAFGISRETHEAAFHGRFTEDLSDYLKLIIDPPPFDFLQGIVGTAPSFLTRLIDPQRASDTVLTGVSLGWDRKRIAAELTTTFGGWESAARRIARTEGGRVAIQSQLAASEELGEAIVAYQVYAVPRTEYSRLDHLKRSGTIYHRNPKGSQLGMDKMPQPPIEWDGSISYNCRCGLIPIFSLAEANAEDVRAMLADAA